MSEPGGGYVELHSASAFSFLRAGSSVEALVARAAALGMPALALTDHMTLAGVVRFQVACAQAGLRGILGVELRVADTLFGAGEPSCVVALAESMTGYARLCQLLTDANLRDSGRSATPAPPVIPFADLAAEPQGLIILTGGVNPAARGPLVAALLAGRRAVAEELARRYLAAFGPERLFIEAQHHLLPESVWLAQALAELAERVGARLALTNGARYATREDYPLYDLLTCVRLGLTVDQSHRERPRNDAEALLAGAELLGRLTMFPWAREALATSGEIADRCLRGNVGLLRPACVAPRVPLPEGMTPRARLEQLCARGLAERYQHAPEALAMESAQRLQLAHELEVICGLELEEFFLCVHDIVSAARRLGIRVSGRGSAANSLVAYLLGITGVDPIAHGLLFARFLTPERRGMPDIDIDVQSDRREELIRYVERTYSERHAAMVANVITYRPRSALRDVVKALGYPLPLVNRLTKLLHHHSGRASLLEAQAEMERAIAASAPDCAGQENQATRRETLLARLPLALALAARLVGLPRHLSLHNGGMVLTREPLAQTLPVRRSANGVRALEVDKDDVERLGLIKFDLLGLRTLGAVEEALALIEETTGARVPIDHLPLDDDATFRLIRAGQTLAVFQIESPGQWHLLAQTQPRTFDDLVAQTALFRPGPLQANMVYPYVQRRQAQQREGQREGQRDAVQTPWKGPPADDFWTAHPVLGVILRESEGILLFQEQILEIAHRFAGLSYADADGFRRAMSHARHPSEMETMRARFVAGARARGETEADATRVFEAISQFVGYGFCKSHAAEFARTIYQTAWLKAHYPAHYLAAFLSCQPAGFFPPHVVLEEAKRLGIPVLPPDLNRSEDRFSVERVGSGRYARWAIRIGLRQVAQVGEDLARAILWERRGGDAVGGERPFTSLEDAIGRLRPQGLTWAAAEALVMCGALDGLAPRMERRRRLWRLHEVWPLLAPARSSARSSGRVSGKRGSAEDRQREVAHPRQLVLDWAQALATPDPAEPPVAVAPILPALDAEARSALDYALLGMSPRPHPMRARRRELQRRGVQTIAELAEAPEGRLARVAGWAISAQRPPTAHGMGFLVLEDETGRLPVALPPKLAERLHALARGGYPLVVAGRVERVRWYRSMFATAVAPCPA
ncbi:MAG TPA: DNA polymerase III subunit alpha [Ktedonobacterales bacterium]|jgi:error-prone DNA polymerase|nr:DNA polymerase III subunit alpha [Ktedonobacterales bacterium]